MLKLLRGNPDNVENVEKCRKRRTKCRTTYMMHALHRRAPYRRVQRATSATQQEFQHTATNKNGSTTSISSYVVVCENGRV